MGTPRTRRIAAGLLVSLLLLVSVAVASAANRAALPPIGENLIASPTMEKAVSPSGFEYFLPTTGNQMLNNLGGNWNGWDEGYWVEWGFGTHMWGLDAQTLHIATNSNVIYSWDGTNWDAFSFQGPYSIAGGIVGFGRDDVYAVGRGEGNSTLYRFVGNAWEIVQTLGNYQISELWGLAGDNLFMAGANGAILYYDGADVHELTNGVFGDVRALWGTGAGNIYAVGNGGMVLHYDGANWTQQAMPGSGGYNLTGVWGSGPDDVWVVGSLGAIYHFNGSAWTEHTITTPAPNFLSVYGSSRTDVWAVGQAGAGYHFDGTEWLVDEALTGYSRDNFPVIWGGYHNEGDQHWASEFGDPREGGQGLNSYTYGVYAYGDGIAVGGNFSMAGPDSLHNMALYNGTGWESLYLDEGPDDLVTDFIEYDGQLVACGMFRTVDGDSIGAVAAWDGQSWVKLGAGLDLDPESYYEAWRMTIFNGDLIVVGTHTVTARWNGETWTPLTGFEGTFYDVAVFEGDVYAAGSTYSPAQGLFILNGDTWELVGNSPMTNIVYTLEVFGDYLYAGGSFNFSSLGFSYLARWSGVAWSSVGNFQGSYVTDLRVYRDELAVAGSFNRIESARYSGAALLAGDGSWRPMGSGLNGYGWGSTVLNDQLYLGGGFSYAGNHSSYFLARWHENIVSPPGVPTTAGTPATAGEDFTVSMNVTGNVGSYPVLLHYRHRDDEPYQVSRMLPTAAKDGLFEGIVPGSFVGDLGFQYYATVQNEFQTMAFPPGDPEDEFYQPAWTGVSMSNFSFAPPTPGQYVMMGIPFVPGASAQAILTGAMGSYDRSQWRFGRWDPTGNRYLEFPQMPDFAPGLGYWLIQKATRAISVNGVTTSTYGGVTISLKPGWNMISTPYNFEIAKSSLTLGANVENRLWARSGGTYVEVQTMNPWQGYFILNTGLVDSEMNIPPTPAIVKTDGAPADKAVPVDRSWEIVIGATMGEHHDPFNTVAVGLQAAAGLDVQDAHEPPAMPGDVSLSFELIEDGRVHRLSSDVRGPFAVGEAWNLVIRTEGGGPVALDFSGVDAVPSEFNVVLYTETGEVDLRKADSTTVIVGDGGESRLRLAVGDPQFVAEQEQNLPRPFALRPNYPNPFNPMTKVVFTLPRDSRVVVDIYDIRGRRVHRLVDDNFSAGLHEVNWTGRDDSGREVSAGVYFGRMTTEDFEQTRKMTLVR